MRLLITIIAIMSAVSFYGCKKDATSPQTKGAAPGKEVQTQLPTEVLPKPEELGYVYDSRGRRDPFTPLVALPTEKGKKGRLAGTLEGYDIDEFKLIGIAEKEGQYYGLLLAPDNKSYTVKGGTVLGLYKGKVKTITGNKVTIIEYAKDYKGKLKKREIVLELRKGKEGE